MKEFHRRMMEAESAGETLKNVLEREKEEVRSRYPSVRLSGPEEQNHAAIFAGLWFNPVKEYRRAALLLTRGGKSEIALLMDEARRLRSYLNTLDLGEEDVQGWSEAPGPEDVIKFNMDAKEGDDESDV